MCFRASRIGGTELSCSPPARMSHRTSSSRRCSFPKSRSERILRKVEAYRTQDHPCSGRPRNERLVTRIETARLAELRSVFVGDQNAFPAAEQEVWWEVWLRSGRREVFLATAGTVGVTVRRHFLSFPGREVVLALGTPERLSTLMLESLAFAEVRLASDLPTFFLDLPVREQVEWAGDLRERLRPVESDTAVTVLDSGANREHPLLQELLSADDQHTVEPAWGVADDASRWGGHGTGMAGLAALGDLTEVLTSGDPIRRTHRLEAVKILPPAGDNRPDLYGAITQEGVARAETQAPHRRRVVCLSVTESANDGGVPSSWSAAVDQIAFGGEGDPRRLVVVAAGNLDQNDVTPGGYLDANDIAGSRVRRRPGML